MESRQGWNYLTNSPKWHYFVDGQSMCGRWLGLGLNDCNDDPKTDNSPDNCAACKKKVVKRRAEAARPAPAGEKE